MKFSVITACWNSAATLRCAIDSLRAQTCRDFEHIIVDGGSVDGTLAIAQSYGGGSVQIIHGPDRGIYDALNKGIQAASGEIIAVLHADDFYAGPGVLDTVRKALDRQGADSCYGDLLYVDRARPEKTVRRWRSGAYRPERFRTGWAPPHPAFFVRKKVHDLHGLYDLRFSIGADYEFMLRVLYHRGISTTYIPGVLVKMRTGGASRPGLLRTPKLLWESYRAWRVSGLPPPLTLALKPVRKLPQYFSALWENR